LDRARLKPSGSAVVGTGCAGLRIAAHVRTFTLAPKVSPWSLILDAENVRARSLPHRKNYEKFRSQVAKRSEKPVKNRVIPCEAASFPCKIRPFSPHATVWLRESFRREPAFAP